MGLWIMVVAIVKKNNKVKFKIQAQAALALGMLNLGPSKPLLSTTHHQFCGQTLPHHWDLLVSGSWPGPTLQKVCKYPEVFNLPEKKSEEEIRF